MIRRTPLKRSPLKRSLVAVNRKRSRPRRGPMRDPAYLCWLRENGKCLACIYVGSFRTGGDWTQEEKMEAARNYANLPCDPAHGPVNGRGSKRPGPPGAIPLCRSHHDEQHRVGWPAFEARYGFSREKEAAARYAAYLLVREADGSGTDDRLIVRAGSRAFFHARTKQHAG